jgi:hypothetical protein
LNFAKGFGDRKEAHGFGFAGDGVVGVEMADGGGGFLREAEVLD